MAPNFLLASLNCILLICISSAPSVRRDGTGICHTDSCVASSGARRAKSPLVAPSFHTNSVATSVFIMPVLSFVTFFSVVAVVVDLDVLSRFVAGVLAELVVVGEHRARREIVAPAWQASKFDNFLRTMWLCYGREITERATQVGQNSSVNQERNC